MKRFKLAVAAIVIIFLAGCYPPKEEVSRYPSVAIPGYGKMDYYALLRHKDPEVVCNAICNLADAADDMGELLSKKDADRSEAEYIDSRKIYLKMRDLTGSKDPRIQASSLRFLQLFSTEYGPKGELIAPALVTPRSAQAACEKIELLMRVASKKWNFDTGMLKTLLGDRSWLVSRAAYGLIDKLENEEMRKGIIERYKKTDIIFEKLLMLRALKSNFSDDTFAFLSEELLTSPDQYIRRMVIDMLRGGGNEGVVISWMEANYQKLRDEDMKYLVSSNLFSMEDGFLNRLFIALLQKGFNPGDAFWERLYSTLREYEGRKERSREAEEALRNLKKLEEAARSDPAVSGSWTACKSRKDAENYVDPLLQKEFSRAAGRLETEKAGAVSRFRAEAAAMFAKYKVDEKARESFLELQDSDLKAYLTEGSKEE